MTRRHLSVILALAVTALFLALAVRNVDVGQLWLALSQARWRWLPAIAGIVLLDLLIRGLRWRILLSSARPRSSTWLLYRLEAIGLSINNVLFMRLGEIARAFLASRELEIPMATALASVAVERALDVGAMLSLFIFAAAGSPELVPASLRRLAELGVAGLVAGFVILIIAEGPLSPGGALERRLARWPRIHDLMLQLAAGAGVLRRPGAALSAVALSLSLWGVDALQYWAGARALGLVPGLDYGRSILVLSWAGAGVALPAAPGAFGTFEAMVKKIAMDFGVSAPQALAFAVFTHLIGYALVTLLGLTFLYFVGLSLGELSSAVQKMDKKAGTPA